MATLLLYLENAQHQAAQFLLTRNEKVISSILISGSTKPLIRNGLGVFGFYPKRSQGSLKCIRTPKVGVGTKFYPEFSEPWQPATSAWGLGAG